MLMLVRPVDSQHNDQGPLADRAKMFHVKHFGTIDGLRNRTFARRGEIRSVDLEQAEYCHRVYFWAVQFLENVFRAAWNFRGSPMTAR